MGASERIMNFIREMKECNINLQSSCDPLEILFFEEKTLQGRIFHDYRYYRFLSNLFTIETLEHYLEGEMEFQDILEEREKPEENLPHLDELLLKLEPRLEHIRAKKRPMLNLKQTIIMKALLQSDSVHIPIVCFRRSIHKYKLLTMLSVVDWSCDVMHSYGSGCCDTTVLIDLDKEFHTSEFEIMLPLQEMKHLICELEKNKLFQNSNDKDNVVDWIHFTENYYTEKNQEAIKLMNEKLCCYTVTKNPFNTVTEPKDKNIGNMIPIGEN
ncbi:hypothetical protein ACT7DC_02740 [Bacillus cereus]